MFFLVFVAIAAADDDIDNDVDDLYSDGDDGDEDALRTVQPFGYGYE